MSSFFPDNIDENELNFCKNVLSKTNHYQHNRTNELIGLIKVSNDAPRAENTNMKVTGTQMSPLLVGKVQFGKLSATHVNHVVHELRLRNIAADKKKWHAQTDGGS